MLGCGADWRERIKRASQERSRAVKAKGFIAQIDTRVWALQFERRPRPSYETLDPHVSQGGRREH